MNSPKKFQIYLKGEDKTESVFDYRRFDDKYEIIFNSGKSFVYNANNVQLIIKKPDPDECFNYLADIAKEVGIEIEVEDGRVINILSNSYSKIANPLSDSMLKAFLNGELEDGNWDQQKNDIDSIYPFGFNVSQKSAVDKAFSNQLSIIEGPPGTGKTQTILNIIANAIIKGSSVAVVSSNNSATKNVFEKLQKNNLDFIAAYLGNTNNKEDFINSQTPLPDISGWSLETEAIVEMREVLKVRNNDLKEKLAEQNQLASLKQELGAFETEFQHFKDYFKRFDIQENLDFSKEIKTSEQAMNMWLLVENDHFISLWQRIIRYFKIWDKNGRLVNKQLKSYPKDFLVTIFQYKFYDLKITELVRKIRDIERKLQAFDFDEKMQEYSKISMKLLQANLAERNAKNKREVYTIEDLWKKSESFIKDYPVILSTTYSLRSCLSGRFMYDYVIIDESSQVDLCTGALALSCARNVIIVGDLKQLPHVVDGKISKSTDRIFNKYNLPETYRYKNNSLLSSLIDIFPMAPRTLLREHYRCHPKIIDFCNKKFYDDQLIILTNSTNEAEPLIVYKAVSGNHERDRINQRQIDIIQLEVIPEQNLNTHDGSLGIITPYRNQTNALQKAFKGTMVKADTVDKFQGQESKVIILSTVDNEISDFTDNANRLNVAISRAIEQLIIVVNDSDSLKDKNIGELVRYVEYYNFTIIESKIQSIFDYLYRNYIETRKEFLLKNKRISKYDSENLMYGLIVEVLKELGISNLAIAIHVPLRMIFRETNLMTDDEENYSMNILSHVDFLIYDKVIKESKFAIEVDGVAFHKEGTDQFQRDILKDEIFKKYGLPLLRFRTDGSGEREILKQVLSYEVDKLKY